MSKRYLKIGAGASILALGLGAFVVPMATAVTSFTAANDATWQIHDAHRPGLDTGSIRTVSQSRVEGFGSLYVSAPSAEQHPYNQEMMRGFGLTLGASGAYESTQSIQLGEIKITREIALDTNTSTARYFDTFTNTGNSEETIEASFGGTLGLGSGDSQGQIKATSSEDTAITPEDSWVLVATNEENRRPVGVVLGSATPFTGALDRLGNQERNPFLTPMATSGHEANFYGFVTKVSIPASESRSLIRYVHVGDVGISPAQEASKELLETLSQTPDFTGLSINEICSVSNWDLNAISGFDAEICPAEVTLPQPEFPEKATVKTTVAYDVVNKSITQLQADLESGKVTSEELTRAYLERIEAYDQGQFGLKSFITVASNAIEQAKAADAKRAAGQRGDLLGIPLGVKDILDTYDMPTTGGTRALEGWQPKQDAYQVEKLREAGAVIIGKTNLSEFANSGSYSESGWGQVWNVLYPSKTSFGSSGGSAVAVAASLAAGSIGTQTGVSLYAPAVGSSLTTFRGTDGIASTRGVMPLTWGQDFAGPIARNVTDLAVLLNTITGTDPDDLLLTSEADAKRPVDWKASLDPNALAGKKIGYIPSSFESSWADDGTGAAVIAQFGKLQDAGATVVPIEAPPSTPRSPSGSRNIEGWARYIGLHDGFPFETGNELLASPLNLPYNVRDLAQTPRMTEEEVQAWLEYRANNKKLIADWMAEQGVDAVVYAGFISDVYSNDSSTSQGSSDRATGVLTSGIGLPTVVVPVGLSPNGYSISMQIVGNAWQDAEVLAMGYALEQQAKFQLTPSIVPALEYAGETPVDPEPTPVDPEPTPVDPEPTPVDPEPTPVDPEPTPQPTLPSSGVPDGEDKGKDSAGGDLAFTGTDLEGLGMLTAALIIGGIGATVFAVQARKKHLKRTQS